MADIEDVLKAHPLKVRPMASVPGSNEFEIFWLIVCVLVGVSFFFTRDVRGGVQEGFPFWAIVLWYGSLGIGSLVGLVGGLWKRTIIPLVDEEPLRDGLKLYAAGWGYVGTASTIFGLMQFTLPEPRIASGMMTFAWGLASLVRAWRVVKLLRGKRGGGRHRD